MKNVVGSFYIVRNSTKRPDDFCPVKFVSKAKIQDRVGFYGFIMTEDKSDVYGYDTRTVLLHPDHGVYPNWGIFYDDEVLCS